MRIYKFRLRFHWSLFQGCNKQFSSTGLDNGLAPSRRQTIIWANDGSCNLLTHLCVTRPQWVNGMLLMYVKYSLSQMKEYIVGLVHDCSSSSALAIESLQSCTKPSIYGYALWINHVLQQLSFAHLDYTDWKRGKVFWNIDIQTKLAILK